MTETTWHVVPVPIFNSSYLSQRIPSRAQTSHFCYASRPEFFLKIDLAIFIKHELLEFFQTNLDFFLSVCSSKYKGPMRKAESLWFWLSICIHLECLIAEYFKMHTSTICKLYLNIYQKFKSKREVYASLNWTCQAKLKPLGTHPLLWPWLIPSKTTTFRDL